MGVQRRALHDQIVEVLRREILREHQPGDRLPAESKQAARFNVSIVTVREALLRLAQEGLIERRQGSGTYVLDNPCRRPGIGLLISEQYLLYERSFFFRRIAQAVQDRLTEAGAETCLHMLPHDVRRPAQFPAQLREQLERGQLRGVISIVGGEGDGIMTAGREADTPVVGLGSDYEYAVTPRPGRLVHMAVDFFLKHQRRKIAMLQFEIADEEERRGGVFIHPFEECLEAHGVPVHEDWIAGSVCPDTPGSTWDHFRRMWHSNGDKPDALLVTDDNMYRDVVPAILAEGIRVPEELLVVTHANRGGGAFYPFPTARLEYNPEDFACQMVSMLDALMAGEKVHPPIVEIPCIWAGRDKVEAILHD